MSNEKDRRRGWRERAGRRLDEFGWWFNCRCRVPLRRLLKRLVRLVETAVEAVVGVAKTSAEAMAQNQTVKTITAGGKAIADVADGALRLREWYERLGFLVTWLGSLIQQTFCSAKCNACAGAFLCSNAYAVALAAAAMASLLILYVIGTVMRA